VLAAPWAPPAHATPSSLVVLAIPRAPLRLLLRFCSTSRWSTIFWQLWLSTHSLYVLML
jgi:hypothetical protein